MQATSLTQCLDSFIKAENLKGDEKVCCDSCRIRQDTVKTMSIHSLPRVFTVHMKRFESSLVNKSTDLRKTDTVVDFPVTGLDLAKYTAGPCALHPKTKCSCAIYDLHALVQHSGEIGNMEVRSFVCLKKEKSCVMDD